MSNEALIQTYENTKVRIVWGEETQDYYLSVADIVQILTDNTDVKQYIKRMRSRDPELNSKWGTICTPVRMIAPDGKQRKTQVATTEISRQRNPKGVKASQRTAQAGGQIAKNARLDLENELGHSVISSKKASDYLLSCDNPTKDN